MKKALAISVGLLMALACADSVTEPGADPLAPAFSASHGRVVQSVTGSGSFVVPTQEGDWRTFAFTARRYDDGTVAGQWQRIRREDGNAADSKSHGVVTCFTIDGDAAWIGGYATTGLFSDPPNNETGFRVVDNGQGANADPDQMSLEFVGAGEGFAADYCETTPESPSPLFDLEAGNIQVKP